MQGIIDGFYKAFFAEQRYLAYLEGLKITIVISFFAILIGVAIGIFIAIMKEAAPKYSGNRMVKMILTIIEKLCVLYVTVIRGTPVMLQLMIIYNMIFTSRDANPVVCAILCFGINSGAYVSEIVRAGIESIDKGQMEAGRSLGFNYIQTMGHIIMPQAVRNILPALGNEFISLVKETSVASVIAVSDIMKQAQYVGSRTFDPLPPYFIAAIVYLVIVVGLSKLLEVFGRRIGQK